MAPARIPFSSGERLVGGIAVCLLAGGIVFAAAAIRSGRQCTAEFHDEICGTAYFAAALFGASPALIGLLMSLVIVWRRSRRRPAREDDAIAPWQQAHRQPPGGED